MCQPVALASAPGVASLTTDGTTVFWTVGSNVYSCPGSGCNGTPFVITNKGPSKPAQILTVAGSVYWVGIGTFAGTIYYCPVSGCGSNAPLVVPKAAPLTDGFVSDGQRLYWSYPSADAGGAFSLTDCPLSTISACMPEAYEPQSAYAAANTDNGSYTIASNGSWVVWLDGTGGNVSACPSGSSCSKVTTLASNRSNLSSLAVDSSRAYWFDSAGLSSCSISGCASPTPITPGSGNSIATDGSDVYWTSGTSVMRANAAGTIETVASNQPGSNFVAVDSARVYWTVNTGWVMSVAK
jgi:hypothetical protein